MPNSVPKGATDSFTSLIPGFMIAFVVLIIDAVLIICNTDIFNLLYVPFSFVSGLVDTWWGVLIIVFLIHGLWFFGIHGATIITSFTSAFVLAPMTSSMVGYFAIATHFVPKNYCPTTMADTGWSERFYRNAKLARRSCNDSRRSCRRSNLVPVHPWL